MRFFRRSLQRLMLVGLAAATGACGGGGGSSGPAPVPTTSTSTSTSTTTGGATTTTVGGGVASYTVTFRLVDAVTLGSLQVEIDYSGTGGQVVGSEGSANCTSPLSTAGALVAFGDDDATSTLSIAALKLTGFSGPTSLARCEVRATSGSPVPGDFVITVIEANAVDTTPVVPLPTVSVSSVAPK